MTAYMVIQPSVLLQVVLDPPSSTTGLFQVKLMSLARVPTGRGIVHAQFQLDRLGLRALRDFLNSDMAKELLEATAGSRDGVH